MFLKLAKMKALPKRKNNYKCVILLIPLVAIIPFVSVNFMMKPACGKLYQNELQQKAFLHSEIQKLEAKRQQLLREIEEYSRNTSPIRRKASIPVDDSSQREQEFKDHDVITVVNKPKDLSELSHRQKRKNCKLSSCFEFKKCPYDREFTVHIYKPYNFGRSVGGNSVTEVYNILKSMPYVKEVNEPIACVFVVIIDPSSLQNSSKLLENVLHNLTFWQGDGHNHIIINFGKGNLLKNVDTGRALVVQTTFGSQAPYRPEFDIVIPPLLSLTKSGVVWENSATQLPAKRKYLLSFAGNYHDNSDKVSNAESFTSVGDLKQLSLQAEDIYIQVSCQAEKNFANYSDWQLCWSRSVRAKILKESTFSLIIQLGDDQTMTLVRLMEALQYGAIPVLISDNVTLPFNDVIDWYRAAIILHEAQFSQMNLILRAILVNDLLSIRRQGRFLWEAYLSTTKSVLESTMAAIQTRLFLPGIPLQGTYFHSVFSEENEPKFYRSNTDVVTRTQSPVSYHNLPTNTVHARQRWNAYPGALFSPPVSPFMPALPSSPAVFESSENMQPIRTAADAGAEFQKALGGNYPVEQFTIIMLTYKREKMLEKALGRLKHIPYLNKVIVIWNTPGDPYSNLTWPNISVPVKVLRPHKNSLNNRFLPLDEIETDAILSLDDDVKMSSEEMVFAFRVWREARDRIVGLPGRYHIWDSSRGGWLYKAKPSCEISMVLTGAAFFHKYYSYLYTHVMAQVIRDKVDEYLNCEDIAMNFLVSHATRKPPIKVTSRLWFFCPDCPSRLYKGKSHEEERNKCINFFEKVYGYMPLLRTQYRADSVLYKAELIKSHKISKCFGSV